MAKKTEKVESPKPKNPPSAMSHAEELSAIWGKRRIDVLNRISNQNYCGPLTVRQLAAIALADRTNFPDGLDTKLAIGDFEGNFCTNVLGIFVAGAKGDHLSVCGDPNMNLI